MTCHQIPTRGHCSIWSLIPGSLQVSRGAKICTLCSVEESGRVLKREIKFFRSCIGRLCSFREGRLCSCCAAKSFQSCPTLCDPIDGSSPGSSVHGIFQARVVEWGAIAFSVCSYWGITKGLQKKLDVIHRQWERKGILGVVTREMQAWQREKLDFCRIVRNLLPGIQGTLKIHDRQE